MTEAGRPGPREPLEVEVGGVIDVPLTGVDGFDGSSDPVGSSPAPNWRRVVAIGLVVGTCLGIAIAVVRATANDEAASTETTVPDDASAAEITTPPTLAPLTVLPAPDIGGASTTVTTTLPDVVRPVYDEIPGIGLAELVQYDVTGAIARLDDDLPRRSETHVELGSSGFVIDVAIERDPVRDRYRLVVESQGATQVAIVDVSSGVTYVNPGTTEGVEVANQDIIDGSTAADVNEYFDRLLLGPLRSDSYDAPSTRGRGLVTIDGVGRAREFVTSIQGELIPEWQVYAFGPVFEFPVEDRPPVLEYAAYVDEDGDIVQVDGVALIGDVAQLVRHRLTVLDEAPLVEVPATTPTSGPVTSATTP